MLKLFKYEMIQSWRNYMYIFFAYLVLCLIVPLSYRIDLSSGFQVVFTILTILLTCMVMGISIGLFITIARNYRNSMFGQNGYLTITLPVSTHQLLAAKILSALLWVLLSGFVLLLGVFVMMIGVVGYSEFFRQFPSLFEGMIQVFLEDGWELLEILLAMTSSILSFILLIFFALTAAHSCYIRNHRIFWAIVIIIVYNAVLSALFNGLHTTLLSFPSNLVFNALSTFNHLWTTMGGNLVESVLLYAGTWFILEKKLEVQ